MTSFNLSLDTRPAMLCEIAKYVSDRSLAFKVLETVESLEDLDVGAAIDSQPRVAVEIFSGGYVIAGPSDIDFPLVDQLWVGRSLISKSFMGY